MANTLNLGDGNWATKEDLLLGYNSENNNYKPLPFDFSRGSNATVVNKDGLIETVGSGEPRIDFKDNTKGALLLEPERSNVLLQSNQFDTTWVKASSTIESGKSGVGGSANAWKLTTSSDFGYLVQTIGVSGTKTFSIYAKSDTTDGIVLRLIGGSNPYVFWSLVDGSYVGSGGGADLIDRKSTSIGNGWFRLDMTTTVNCTSVRVYSGDSDGNFASGSIYIQYAQLEQGSYATSYIPTSGSAVTRISDICNNGGNEQVFNDSEGVLYAEVKGSEEVPTSSGYIAISSPSVSFTNAAVLQFRDNGDLRFYFGGSATENIQFIASDINLSDNNKIAVQYDSNGSNYKLFVNGVSISRFSAATNQSVSGLSELNLIFGTGLSFIGEVKDIKVYNTALTDQELEALTTI
jgi:hypothetical protein